MTRKHFARIADMLKNNKPEDKESLQYIDWATMVSNMAGICAESNSRFNHAKFYEACGYDRS